MASVAAQQSARVLSLYRKAMCLAREHSIQRQAFHEEADWIRAEFRRYQNEKDPLLISDLIKATEAKVKLYMHPEPYLAARAYKGFEYQRNTPPPEQWLRPEAFIANKH